MYVYKSNQATRGSTVASIQVVAVFDSWERDGRFPASGRGFSEWAWFQRRQRTRPQRLRAESCLFFKDFDNLF